MCRRQLKWSLIITSTRQNQQLNRRVVTLNLTLNISLRRSMTSVIDIYEHPITPIVRFQEHLLHPRLRAPLDIVRLSIDTINILYV